MDTRELAEVFHALSDETRLRIFGLLMERECCVCEVMQVLDISQTRASRNLNILYDAGLLKQRRVGLWALYSIDRERVADVVCAVGSAVGSIAAIQQDRMKLNQSDPMGPCCSTEAGQATCCPPPGKVTAATERTRKGTTG